MQDPSEVLARQKAREKATRDTARASAKRRHNGVPQSPRKKRQKIRWTSRLAKQAPVNLREQIDGQPGSLHLDGQEIVMAIKPQGNRPRVAGRGWAQASDERIANGQTANGRDARTVANFDINNTEMRWKQERSEDDNLAFERRVDDWVAPTQYESYQTPRPRDYVYAEKVEPRIKGQPEGQGKKRKAGKRCAACQGLCLCNTESKRRR